jgi:16S rRNA (cytosine967-C5)-methyltransferase
MRQAACAEAAIEILDLIISAARIKGAPADRLIVEYFRGRRYAGSKDRRYIRELVYQSIRSCGPIPKDGRSAMLRLAEKDPSILSLFDASKHGPAFIDPQEKIAEGGIASNWIVEELTKSGISTAEMEVLLERAPLDLRVNSLKADRNSLVLPTNGENLTSRQGVRVPNGTKVEVWLAYQNGEIEIQDCGSQLACDAFAALPGEIVIDLCAGAGGKSLAIAADMQNEGKIIACDTNKSRLDKLPARASRAGAKIIETRLLNTNFELEGLEDLKGKANAILIDAPCSGSGTWRRNPEARWRLDQNEIARLTLLQDRLIDIAVSLLSPNGRLVFVTCSLFDQEGTHRVEAALLRHKCLKTLEVNLPIGRKRGSGVRLSPSKDNTDGFFISMFEVS